MQARYTLTFNIYSNVAKLFCNDEIIEYFYDVVDPDQDTSNTVTTAPAIIDTVVDYVGHKYWRFDPIINFSRTAREYYEVVIM